MLWAVCYRMTGSAADADELVQDTFLRALEHAPTHRDPQRDAASDLRPWLVRVAINLARDRLRRRKREASYDGPWLPVPVALEAHDDTELPDARYGRLESATLAFLVALEALSPLQRAVLLLRDVFDRDTAETALALEISEANVKTTLHRARRAMAEHYDGRRCQPQTQDFVRHRATLGRLLFALASGNLNDLERLLAEDVRTVQDAGGVYHAARNVLQGRATVALLLAGVSRKGPLPIGLMERTLNGLPTWLIELPPVPGRRYAPRIVMQLDLDARGLVREVFLLTAPDKVAQAWAGGPLSG